MAHDAGQTRWMSYAELAEARGIDKLSAMRMARRRRWLKQTANDGTVRVLVPETVLETRQADPRDIPSDVVRRISALETREKMLGELVEQGRAEAVELREQVAGLREERAAALARADELRAVVERLTAVPGAAAWARLRRMLPWR
jgi:hypothetical protein